VLTSQLQRHILAGSQICCQIKSPSLQSIRLSTATSPAAMCEAVQRSPTCQQKSNTAAAAKIQKENPELSPNY
jgi:hypothetical protein